MWTKCYEVKCRTCGLSKKFIADYRYPAKRGELNRRQAEALALENGWGYVKDPLEPSKWLCPTCRRKRSENTILGRPNNTEA